MLLSKEQILAAQDLPTEDVPVPEWGGAVRIRTLSGAERDRWEESRIRGRGKDRRTNYENITASLIALCAVDGEGKRLFGEAEVHALGRKSSKVLGRLFDACRRLNGLSDEEVEALAGELKNAPSGSSGSD